MHHDASMTKERRSIERDGAGEPCQTKSLMPQPRSDPRSKLDLSWIDETPGRVFFPREFYFYATWGVMLIIMSVLSLPFQQIPRDVVKPRS